MAPCIRVIFPSIKYSVLWHLWMCHDHTNVNVHTCPHDNFKKYLADNRLWYYYNKADKLYLFCKLITRISYTRSLTNSRLSKFLIRKTSWLQYTFIVILLQPSTYLFYLINRLQIVTEVGFFRMMEIIKPQTMCQFIKNTKLQNIISVINK